MKRAAGKKNREVNNKHGQAKAICLLFSGYPIK